VSVNNIGTLIIGAGVAGLGAAKRCRELGNDYLVLEANSSAGGLLDNFVIDGFLFDNAVHLSFASEPEVREIFDKVDYITHPADSLTFDQDRWLKHPVQNNLYPLEADEKVELIDSLINRKDYGTPSDYESWLRHQYGDAIAERYPLKYTQKYWQCDASELSVEWIGNRMRRTDIKEVLYGAFSPETPNTYYTKEMRYPKEGGFKSFIGELVEEANIAYDNQVTAINLDEQIVTTASGKIYHYESLVSSLPLPTLMSVVEDAPTNVKSAASKLEATSIDLISVAFNKEIIKDLWFYIYDTDIYASRAYSPSVKSPNNVPKGCSSLQFEIYNPGRESQYTEDVLRDNVLYALNKMGIASSDDIEFMHHKHLKWGNVTFKKGMETSRQQVLDFVKSYGISSVGRFGEWDYLWSNQSFLSGYRFDQS